MADWMAFGAVAVTLTVFVLFLARATQSALESPRAGQPRPAEPGVAEEVVVDEQSKAPAEFTLGSISAETLMLNVASTQALFLFILLGGIWYTEVPLRSLGVVAPTAAELGGGVALGVVLFALNQAGAKIGRRFGLGGKDTANRTGAVGKDAANRAGAAGEDTANRTDAVGDEALREALAPETVSGWLALLFVVLPIVAGFEELLFRGALVGGSAAGFGVPVALLVVASSAAFALGHGIQGRVGVVVTGLLGLVLAGAFVATGNLVVVGVAHYLMNSLEFVVCEGIRG